MTAFSHGIGPAALVNSLSTVVLKLCAPGVPDFYQGTELVEATLTDPDNRRPVDFAARAEILTALPEPSGTAAASLLARWVDGHIKMYVMRTLLRDRREHAQLYEHGRYEPLSATTRHIAAFRRHLDGHGSVVAVVPRLVYRLARGGFPQGVQIWQEETLSIPRVGSGQYQDILTGRTIEAAGDVRLSQLLDLLPVAVLQEAP
jgi:(1->4)-alpha-D-glucan 1-alpha-D-glucosylmutase